MPLSVAISVSQSGLAPDTVAITDASSGSDVLVTQRRAIFQTPQATYLVTSGVTTTYNEWAYADASKSFAVLPQDYAIALTVQWLDVANVVRYTLTQVYCFPQYNKQFMYYLAQQMAMSYTIIQSLPYFTNIATYWANIVGAVNAVETGADIAASQACLDRATDMKANQQDYFS